MCEHPQWTSLATWVSSTPATQHEVSWCPQECKIAPQGRPCSNKRSIRHLNHHIIDDVRLKRDISSHPLGEPFGSHRCIQVEVDHYQHQQPEQKRRSSDEASPICLCLVASGLGKCPACLLQSPQKPYFVSSNLPLGRKCQASYFSKLSLKSAKTASATSSPGGEHGKQDGVSGRA